MIPTELMAPPVAGDANVQPAKSRLVITAPPALPTDGITEDALVGVWTTFSPGNNLLFSDMRDRDPLR